MRPCWSLMVKNIYSCTLPYFIYICEHHFLQAPGRKLVIITNMLQVILLPLKAFGNLLSVKWQNLGLDAGMFSMRFVPSFSRLPSCTALNA